MSGSFIAIVIAVALALIYWRVVLLVSVAALVALVAMGFGAIQQGPGAAAPAPTLSTQQPAVVAPPLTAPPK